MCIFFRNENAVSYGILPFSPDFHVFSYEVTTKFLSKQEEKEQGNICKGPEVREAERNHVHRICCSKCRKSFLKRVATRGEIEKPHA